MKILRGIFMLVILLFVLPTIALTNAPKTKFSHKVRRGQTLGLIAKTYGMTIKGLKSLNGIKSDLIRVGDKFIVEPKEVTVVTSWYGARFHGRPMANGKIFDMNKINAAHKVLPLGTMIAVTNPKNKKTLVMEVTDRGPYINGRELDLSREAARRLGVKKDGVAKVKMRIISTP